jgi:XTP/dITP diphosphohydrolase
VSELLIATQNQGKLAEIRTILSNSDYRILTPVDVGIVADFDVEETGKTYEQNAELKAIAFGQVALMLTVADDSGLSVNALDGRPGVYSKRYAPGSDHDRNVKLLSEMEGKEDRAAAFITVLCLYDPELNTSTFFEGRVDGKITQEITKGDGFGYDPVFIPDGYTKTFAELGQEVKNNLSHRSRALEKLKNYLNQK